MGGLIAGGWLLAEIRRVRFRKMQDKTGHSSRKTLRLCLMRAGRRAQCVAAPRRARVANAGRSSNCRELIIEPKRQNCVCVRRMHENQMSLCATHAPAPALLRTRRLLKGDPSYPALGGSNGVDLGQISPPPVLS